jgi:ABC-type glycerol-3-phosphate transport system substrate-binding protein
MELNRVKKILIIAAIAAILLAAGILALVLIRQSAAMASAREIPLTLLLASGDEKIDTALREVLKTYRSLYPKILVELRTAPSHSSPEAIRAMKPDVVIRSLPESAADRVYAEPPVPWSGQLWVLAARSDYLAAAAARQPETVAALKAGTATTAQFEALLADAAGAGFSPIAIGNSHRWPFVLWLQHWTAATAGPGAANAIPSPTSSAGGAGSATVGDADPYAALRPAFDTLMAWKAKGWLGPSTWKEGWAAGFVPLDTGKAAFALVSAAYMSPISPATRSALVYLPFPRRPDDGPWSVGQASYVGVSATTKEAEAARGLLRFLTSPGITSRLAGLTARPFFAWDPKTGASPTVLPDWSAGAQTPAYEALARELDPDR